MERSEAFGDQSTEVESLLSPRQLDVARLVMEGFTNKEIAARPARLITVVISLKYRNSPNTASFVLELPFERRERHSVTRDEDYREVAMNSVSIMTLDGSMAEIQSPEIESMRERFSGKLLLPDDAGYDVARRAFGLSCDNLESVQIVTTDGEARTASISTSMPTTVHVCLAPARRRMSGGCARSSRATTPQTSSG